ncbi:MAG TPA: amidohydrolase family protein [Acidimicrobiales bacterium]|nr:amidohydrolase family protein [Acidimicrobiales bacterium]
MTSGPATSGEKAPIALVVANATLMATVDEQRRELAGGWVAIDDGRISAIGTGVPPAAHRTLDASGCLVTPGLVNVHHHMYQNLTRSYRPATSEGFLGWLDALYPLWERLDEEAIESSTWIALAELARSGCTTTSDHLYLQNTGCGSFFDAQVAAAAEVGLRFTACRGSIDRSRRHGALPPDGVAQDTDTILADCERVVDTYHDRGPLSFLRVALAPHSVYAASDELMRGTAELGERLDVRIHTHLAADRADDAAAEASHGLTPFEWFDSLGWTTSRAWVAHCIFPSASEIGRLGRAGVGVAHCATACLLMGVGITPVTDLRAAGCPVGLGVDGSSNSDSGSAWLEARMALLAGRFRAGPAAMSARDVLELATVGGAACLGRSGEVGELSLGAAGDLVVWPLDDLAHAGAVSDPIDAWLRCGPTTPRHVVVGGRAIVEGGELLLAGLDDRLRRHDRIARNLQGC